MARATMTRRRQPAFVDALVNALEAKLRGSDVSVEHIRGSRYRFVVVWNRFRNVGHPERQRKVWSIAEAVVPVEKLLDVGMILTVAPDEI